MKKIIILSFLLRLNTIAFGQIEEVSECLDLIKLTESTYVHTCNNNARGHGGILASVLSTIKPMSTDIQPKDQPQYLSEVHILSLHSGHRTHFVF